MKRNEKKDENAQNEEEEETQEPLLGSKAQAVTITPGRVDSGQPMAEKIQPSIVPSETDVVLQLAGPWGIWQARTTAIVFLTKIPAAWFMACIIFTAPSPWYQEYHCDLTDFGHPDNGTSFNHTYHPAKLTASGTFEYDYCRVYPNASQDKRLNLMILMTDAMLKNEKSTVPCKNFIFNLEKKATLVTQFDLVCSRSILVAITQCFHLFGVLLGGVIATELMAFFSPRRVMMAGMILQIIIGIATGYAPWFWLHVAFRCFAACCCALTFTPANVIMTDIAGGKYKTIISANFEQFWSVGVLLLTAIGYFVKTWSLIYITISVPTALIMFLWIWIPDAPRWHLEKGNIKTARLILENGIKVNDKNASLPENIDELLKAQAYNLISKKTAELKVGWRQLFAIKGAWWRIIFVITSWSLMYTCYYGTLLNIRSFGRQHLFYTTAIAGLCEIFGGFIGFIILMRVKCKWACVGAFTGISGVINCIIWMTPTHVNGSHMLKDLIVISMINKMGISASLCVLTTCTAELFPVEHKRRAVYASTVMARTIFITAPLIGFMAIFGDGVSLSAFGVLTAISGLCTFLLSPLKIPKKENTSNVWTINIDKNERTKL